jgi:hypothetical protein
MNIKKIKLLQSEYGYSEMQDMINSGIAWKMEGSIGRKAMSLLECGACMLPEEMHKDYYGNTIPSREMLKEGTKGTLSNSQRFWQGVEDGSIFIEHD